MLGFCSSVEFSSFFLNFNLKNFKPIIFYIYSFVCFSYCSFSLAVNLNVYKSSLSNSVYICISILSFFSFFLLLSTYFSVLFSLLYSPIGTLLQCCFPVCALLSFVLGDISFGFLCLPDQSILLYFCWIVLILLMGVYVCVYIQSYFYCCYKPLPLCWAFAVLQSFPFFFLFSFL